MVELEGEGGRFGSLKGLGLPPLLSRGQSSKSSGRGSSKGSFKMMGSFRNIFSGGGSSKSLIDGGAAGGGGGGAEREVFLETINGGDTRHHRVEGLTGGKRCACQVRAYAGAPGVGSWWTEWSSRGEHAMIPGVVTPEAPNGIKLRSDRVRCWWPRPVEKSCCVSSYEVVLCRENGDPLPDKEDGTFVSKKTVKATKGVETESVTFHGVPSGVDCYVRVRAMLRRSRIQTGQRRPCRLNRRGRR